MDFFFLPSFLFENKVESLNIKLTWKRQNSVSKIENVMAKTFKVATDDCAKLL